MTSDRIKEIQETTAYPQSQSVYLALLQVWNECEQRLSKEEPSGWISVEERMPEDSEDVLMYFGHIYMGFHTSEGWHFAEEGERVGGLRFITHWMPLPKKPVILNED